MAHPDRRGFLVCLFITLLGMADGQAGLTTAAYTAVQLIALFGIPAAMTWRSLDTGCTASTSSSAEPWSTACSRPRPPGCMRASSSASGRSLGHRSGPLLTIAAAVMIALLFQPLRRRAQLLANRLVYGNRATPYQALSDFAGPMTCELDLAEAVDRSVSVLAGATGPTGPRPGSGSARNCARPRSGRLDRPRPPPSRSARATACLRFPGASRAVAVTHGGELLGALCLHKPPNEALTSTEDELIRHLASQAGLVLRNAALTAQLRATIEELRASRRRLVKPRTPNAARSNATCTTGRSSSSSRSPFISPCWRSPPTTPRRRGSSSAR